MNERMSPLEYHVLLALVDGPLHGYAIKDAVAAESAGTLQPRAGTLYRVLARLMVRGLLAEADPVEPTPPHPGLARKYCSLTAAGRTALGAEARRLKAAARLAEARLGMAGGGL
jgi:PadR family transcriptional regulator, regulatory protein PadR